MLNVKLTVDELKRLIAEDVENAYSILLLTGPDAFEADYDEWINWFEANL